MSGEAAVPLERAAPASLGMSEQRLDRLGQVMREEIARGRLPGAVALIARRGRIAYLESFGRLDPAADTPMSDDAIFRIYSMTKPITSVAAMMLLEDGRLLLSDPIAKHLPEFAELSVGVAQGQELTRVPLARPVTIQDLLRHTSGMTYEFRGSGPVHKLYSAARIHRRSQTNADHAATLAGMPLLHQPGTRWEYGRSTDVLGRLIEVLSGERLGAHFERRILGPLGMHDTAFHVPPDKHARIAQGFARDPDGGGGVQLLEVRDAPRFESGGGGLVSTAADYARFLQMMLSGGALGATRLLGRKSIELMTSDHLGAISGASDLLLPGHGFGLGFSVRLQAGMAPVLGSVGQYFWGGLAGTTFWVDPAEQLFAILMIQAPGQRDYYRTLYRDLVYAALGD